LLTAANSNAKLLESAKYHAAKDGLPLGDKAVCFLFVLKQVNQPQSQKLLLLSHQQK